MNPRRRPLPTCFLILALLFSQWALATYACAMPSIGAVAMADADDMAGMDCEGDAPDRSMLCVKHCADDQAANPAQPGPADFGGLAAAVIPTFLQPRLLPDRRFVVASWQTPRQTAPPLLLSARLRI